MSTSDSSPFNRTLVYLCLGFALLLTIGTVVATKLVSLTGTDEPIALNALNSPLAESPECASLIDALPDSAAEMTRRELMDPAPAGAAAFANDATNRVTLRCGVELPLQFTTLSSPSTVEDIDWLPVFDDTPGSSMQTWYSVKTKPVVAVTLDNTKNTDAHEVLEDLADATSTLPTSPSTPHQPPLADLTATPGPECVEVLSHLPKKIEDYSKIYLTKAQGLSPATSAAWTSTGKEPIVLRCGVPKPAGYKPGVQLVQINDIPWFEDTTTANGTTAGVWYPLGRNVDIAVSVPTSSGNATLVALSEVVAHYA